MSKNIKYFILLVNLLFIAFLQNAFSQCILTDNSRSSLFIEYEKTALVKIDGEDKMQQGVLLRLVNNSNCSITITTGSADKFTKPLPSNPTIQQLTRRDIDYILPDGDIVPEVQYSFDTLNGFGRNVGGDNFYGFQLLGNRSILFEVPFKHLDQRFNSKIDLEFQYTWEIENRAKNVFPSVTNTVRYYSAELPEPIKQEIKKRLK